MTIANKIVEKILGKDKKIKTLKQDNKVRRQKEKEEWLRQEINTCDKCLKLKIQGIVPSVCQYHIDKQFE